MTTLLLGILLGGLGHKDAVPRRVLSEDAPPFCFLVTGNIHYQNNPYGDNQVNNPFTASSDLRPNWDERYTVVGADSKSLGTISGSVLTYTNTSVADTDSTRGYSDTTGGCDFEVFVRQGIPRDRVRIEHVQTGTATAEASPSHSDAVVRCEANLETDGAGGEARQDEPVYFTKDIIYGLGRDSYVHNFFGTPYDRYAALSARAHSYAWQGGFPITTIKCEGNLTGTIRGWLTYGRLMPGHQIGPHVRIPTSCNATVDLGDGNYEFQMPDPVPTRGYPLANAISLNSQVVEADRPMGNATFSYDIHVRTRQIFTEDAQVETHWFLVDGDGAQFDYGLSSGPPSPEPGAHGKLTALAGGGFQLVQAGPPGSINATGNFYYRFDADGRLILIIDPNGNHQTVSYTGGKILNVFDVGSNKRIHFEWSGDRISKIAENEGGAVTVLGYSGGKLASLSVGNDATGESHSAQFAYRASDGLLDSVTQDNDPVSRQKITYSMLESHEPSVSIPRASVATAVSSVRVGYERGNLNAYSFRADVATATGGKIHYDFDKNGDLLRIETPVFSGATAPPVYTFASDAQRNLTQVTGPHTSIAMVYDSLGNLTQMRDGAGGVWRNTYTRADLKHASDSVSTLVDVSYGNSGHLPRSVSDANGSAWKFDYNAFGQLVGETPPTDSPSAKAEFAYEENASSPALGWLRSAQDGTGNRLSVDAYSLLGDVTSLTTSPTPGVSNTTTTSYDADHRPLVVTHPDGKTQTYAYSGRRLTSTTDENGIQTSYDFCRACGVLNSVSGPLGWSIHLDHNNDRDLSAFIDARQNKTLFLRGLARELKEIRYPDATRTIFGYDSDGRVAKVVNGRGQAAAIAYDAASRVQRIGYSSNGPMIVQTHNLDGTVKSVTDGTGTKSVTYWPNKQVRTVTYDDRSVGLAKVQTLQYGYYSEHRLASLVWLNDGEEVARWTYTYDGAGRQTSVKGPGGTTTFSYDGEGKLKTQINPNGTSMTLAYNEARGWPVRIANLKGSTTLSQFDLQYDQGLNTVGNLTRVRASDGSEAAYDYDDLYRLTSEAINRRQTSYQYDLAGNMTGVNGAPVATYDAANKMSSVVGGNASYDADGNLTAISGPGLPTASFNWDARNKLTRQTGGDVTVDYDYDAEGHRVWSQAGPSPKRFYIFAGNLLIGEVGADGTPQASYTWGANGLVSETLPGAKTFWYHFGPQGETRELTDSRGLPVAMYAYTAYGVPTSTKGNVTNPFRYGGRFGYYTDGPNNLLLCTQRWYSPQLAHWISRDPVGYQAGDNQYRYCQDAPTSYSDPSGNDVWVIVWGPHLEGWDLRPGHAGLIIQNSGGRTTIDNWPVRGGGWHSDTGFWDKTRPPNLFLDDTEEATDNISVFKVSGLDEEAMEKWWDKNKMLGWNLFQQNCADTVYEALEAGGLHLPRQYISSPSGLAKQLNSLVGIKQPSSNP